VKISGNNRPRAQSLPNLHTAPKSTAAKGKDSKAIQPEAGDKKTAEMNPEFKRAATDPTSNRKKKSDGGTPNSSEGSDPIPSNSRSATSNSKWSISSSAATIKSLKDFGSSLKKIFQKATTPDYWRHSAGQHRMNGVLPKETPSLTKSGKTPVGPNKYESMSEEERKNFSPDYPLKYDVPVKTGHMTNMKPTGEPAGFQTGPGMLNPEHKVPGKFDYSQIPDYKFTVNKDHPRHDENRDPAMALRRKTKIGLPADPKTGFPTAPIIKGYDLTKAAFPEPLRDLNEGPVIHKAVDPYDLDNPAFLIKGDKP
jgi:hypothetical protein